MSQRLPDYDAMRASQARAQEADRALDERTENCQRCGLK